MVATQYILVGWIKTHGRRETVSVLTGRRQEQGRSRRKGMCLRFLILGKKAHEGRRCLFAHNWVPSIQPHSEVEQLPHKCADGLGASWLPKPHLSLSVQDLGDGWCPWACPLYWVSLPLNPWLSPDVASHLAAYPLQRAETQTLGPALPS